MMHPMADPVCIQAFKSQEIIKTMAILRGQQQCQKGNLD